MTSGQLIEAVYKRHPRLRGMRSSKIHRKLQRLYQEGKLNGNGEELTPFRTRNSYGYPKSSGYSTNAKSRRGRESLRRFANKYIQKYGSLPAPDEYESHNAYGSSTSGKGLQASRRKPAGNKQIVVVERIVEGPGEDRKVFLKKYINYLKRRKAQKKKGKNVKGNSIRNTAEFREYLFKRAIYKRRSPKPKAPKVHKPKSPKAPKEKKQRMKMSANEKKYRDYLRRRAANKRKGKKVVGKTASHKSAYIRQLQEKVVKAVKLPKVPGQRKKVVKAIVKASREYTVGPKSLEMYARFAKKWAEHKQGDVPGVNTWYKHFRGRYKLGAAKRRAMPRKQKATKPKKARKSPKARMDSAIKAYKAYVRRHKKAGKSPTTLLTPGQFEAARGMRKGKMASRENQMRRKYESYARSRKGSVLSYGAWKKGMGKKRRHNKKMKVAEDIKSSSRRSSSTRRSSSYNSIDNFIAPEGTVRSSPSIREPVKRRRLVVSDE